MNNSEAGKEERRLIQISTHPPQTIPIRKFLSRTGQVARRLPEVQAEELQSENSHILLKANTHTPIICTGKKEGLWLV